jgi:hypothetical protein
MLRTPWCILHRIIISNYILVVQTVFELYWVGHALPDPKSPTEKDSPD